MEKAFCEELAMLDFSDLMRPHDQFEYHGYDSLDDVLAELQRLLSSEAIAASRVEYARYRDLVAEALAKGFVKGGNCSNVRRVR